MRHGQSWWDRLKARATEAASTTPPPRQPRALRPGAGAEAAGLEGRMLLSTAAVAANPLKLVTYEAPTVSLNSQSVTTGADGNLWFTEPAVNAVGRMTPAGTVSEFSLPVGHTASGGIAAGPDGNVWFGEGSLIGRVTPSGDVSEFAVDPKAHVTGVTGGPDGNVWFMDTGNQKVGRVDPFGDVAEFSIPPSVALKSVAGVNLNHDIAAGPDGNVWYTTETYNHRTGVESGQVGRITPSGEVTVFNLPAARAAHKSGFLSPKRPQPKGGMLADAITAGPDGNVWITEHQSNGPAAIARVTPAGKFTQFALNGPKGTTTPDVPLDITTGPDHNLWFNIATDDFQSGPDAYPYVGRITPNGRVTVYPIPSSTDAQGARLAEGAESITSGPDGRLWFTGGSRRYVSHTGRVLGAFTPPET